MRPRVYVGDPCETLVTVPSDSASLSVVEIPTWAFHSRPEKPDKEETGEKAFRERIHTAVEESARIVEAGGYLALLAGSVYWPEFYDVDRQPTALLAEAIQAPLAYGFKRLGSVGWLHIVSSGGDHQPTPETEVVHLYRNSGKEAGESECPPGRDVPCLADISRELKEIGFNPQRQAEAILNAFAAPGSTILAPLGVEQLSTVTMLAGYHLVTVAPNEFSFIFGIGFGCGLNKIESPERIPASFVPMAGILE